MIVNLTQQFIATLPKDVEGYWSDSTLSGFIFLRRRAKSGTMLDRYLGRSGKQPKLTLDAQKVTFTQARDAVKKYLARIELGADLRAEKKAKLIEAARMTYGQGVPVYLKARAEETVRPLRQSSLKQMALYLENPAYFGFGQKALDDITGAEVTKRLDIICRDSGAQTAARARSILFTFFEWCIAHGHATKNPVVATEKPKTAGGRERVLSNDELRAIWNACADDDYGRIVRLLILTGCRREEIGGLRWSEVNLNESTITIATERSKNHRTHTLTLPATALNILKAVPQRVGSDYVFGSNGFTMWSHSKTNLNDGCAAWRLHDARRTVATGMADIGVLPHTIEAVLNHISGHKAGVAGIYNRSDYRQQMKTALAMWADHVESIVTGTPTKITMLRAG
jgi:integrase